MEIFSHKKNASIDLLRDEEKIKSSSQKKLVLTVCGVVLSIVSLVAASIFIYSLSQKFALSKAKKDIEQKTKAWIALESIGTNVKTISAKDQIITSAASKYSKFQKNLNKMREVLPVGITLTTLVLDDTGKGVITGKSSEAATIYQFYEILKKEKTVKNPVLDSLSKDGIDYSFSISLTLESQ